MEVALESHMGLSNELVVIHYQSYSSVTEAWVTNKKETKINHGELVGELSP